MAVSHMASYNLRNFRRSLDFFNEIRDSLTIIFSCYLAGIVNYNKPTSSI